MKPTDRSHGMNCFDRRIQNAMTKLSVRFEFSCSLPNQRPKKKIKFSRSKTKNLTRSNFSVACFVLQFFFSTLAKKYLLYSQTMLVYFIFFAFRYTRYNLGWSEPFVGLDFMAVSFARHCFFFSSIPHCYCCLVLVKRKQRPYTLTMQNEYHQFREIHCNIKFEKEKKKRKLCTRFMFSSDLHNILMLK